MSARPAATEYLRIILFKLSSEKVDLAMSALHGVEAYEVKIEVHVGTGNADRVAVVGLPDEITRVKSSAPISLFAVRIRVPSGLNVPYRTSALYRTSTIWGSAKEAIGFPEAAS